MKNRWILVVRTAIGYPYYKDSPLRDHGNQNCLISVVTQRGVLVVRIAYGCPYNKDPAIFHLFLKYHKWKIVYSLLTICLSASHYGLPVRPRCLFSWEYLWKDSWGLPMRAKSSKQRCPALCLIDTIWSPWLWPRRSSPWPRGLKSSKIGLSSARGQHYFLEC